MNLQKIQRFILIFRSMTCWDLLITKQKVERLSMVDAGIIFLLIG